jgi:hypothetical protein
LTNTLRERLGLELGGNSVSVIDPSTAGQPAPFCPSVHYPLGRLEVPLPGPGGIAVDFDGNVWWRERRRAAPDGERSTVVEECFQSQCGGNGAVVVFGLAAPVAAPLIGPPVRP